MRRILSLLAFAGLLLSCTAQPAKKDRAAELVSRMTLDEKISLIAGDKEHGFFTMGIPRLGIPAVETADGPQGIRRHTKSTLYPSGIATAAWLDRTPALLLAWYSGQCYGKVVAEILTGKVSPSGRLPITFWGTLDKNPAQQYYEPVEKAEGSYRDPVVHSDYTEGVFLGYRGVEHFGVEPLFPFGFGLTYSSFAYSDVSVARSRGGLDVRFTLTNTGAVAAAEVAQVYVAPVAPSLPRPAHELKGFVKKALGPGESARLTVHLDRDAFAHYDMYTHGWVVDPGQYEIQVGASSADIRLRNICKMK